MVPGLGHDAGGLHQNPGEAKIAIDRDSERRLDAKPFRTKAVPLLDPALGIAAVAAHVPFAGRTGRARQRIGTPHDTDNRIACGKTTALRRLLHNAQRLVTEHQSFRTFWCCAVQAVEYFMIGAADAERTGADENRAV